MKDDNALMFYARYAQEIEFLKEHFLDGDDDDLSPLVFHWLSSTDLDGYLELTENALLVLKDELEQIWAGMHQRLVACLQKADPSLSITRKKLRDRPWNDWAEWIIVPQRVFAWAGLQVAGDGTAELRRTLWVAGGRGAEPKLAQILGGGSVLGKNLGFVPGAVAFPSIRLDTNDTSWDLQALAEQMSAPYQQMKKAQWRDVFALGQPASRN